MTRYLVVCTLLISGFTAWLSYPATALADNTSTFCKWAFSWPHTVYYYVNTGDFGIDGGLRVQYGGNTWTEANFNLILQRDSNGLNPNYVDMAVLDDPGTIARTTITYQQTPSCTNNPSPNPYWQIYSAHTNFNSQDKFYSDCLAAGTQWCNQNHYYDIHDIASHEFGHWFHLLDTYSAGDSADTMYGFASWGDVYQRDLAAHDKNQAWSMYGCRNGGTTQNC